MLAQRRRSPDECSFSRFSSFDAYVKIYSSDNLFVNVVFYRRLNISDGHLPVFNNYFDL